MDQLTILSNNILTMSSREVAALCEKRHDHVLRDIENLNATYAQMGFPKVGEGYYTHPNTGNQQHRLMWLPPVGVLKDLGAGDE